jgi:hypothetical protein
MPALTVTLSANGDGSAMGDSVEVGWVFGLGGVGLVIQQITDEPIVVHIDPLEPIVVLPIRVLEEPSE